jgi:predicted ATPase
MIKVIEEEITGPSQWIVETHSEAMISRIQRRVREGRLSPEKVSVLYVEATPSGSEIRELRLNEAGDFLDEWPGGFFEESYRDAVGLAIEDPKPSPEFEALNELAEVE